MAPFDEPFDEPNEEQEEKKEEEEDVEEVESTGGSDAKSKEEDVDSEGPFDEPEQIPLTPEANTQEDLEAGLKVKDTDHTVPPSPSQSDVPRDEVRSNLDSKFSGDDDDEQPSKWQRYKKPFCCAVILVLFAILLVIIIFLVRSQANTNGNANNSSSGFNDGLDDDFEGGKTIDINPDSPNQGGSNSSPVLPGSPTASPVATAPPKNDDAAPLLDYLKLEYSIEVEEGTSGRMAVDWLVDEADGSDLDLTEKLAQRFALLAMDFSLSSNTTEDGRKLAEGEELKFGMRGLDECNWTGIVCDDSLSVTDIQMATMDLPGSIPTEIGMLESLTYLDLSSNQIKGKIPEEVYNLQGLERIYLYKNQLSGTVSSKLGDLWNITHYHVSHNQLSGSIPKTLKSRNGQIFKIRYFNVYSNQMTGPIQESTRLRFMYYMDLGRNQFTGTLPTFEGYVRLRHMHLDHNEFTGTVPSTLITTGSDRLMTLSLNDNKLSGALPGNHQELSFLVQFTVQHNEFTSMDKKTCQLNVFEGGELSEFRSDCNICKCGKGLMCDFCSAE